MPLHTARLEAMICPRQVEGYVTEHNNVIPLQMYPIYQMNLK